MLNSSCVPAAVLGVTDAVQDISLDNNKVCLQYFISFNLNTVENSSAFNLTFAQHVCVLGPHNVC